MDAGLFVPGAVAQHDLLGVVVDAPDGRPAQVGLVGVEISAIDGERRLFHACEQLRIGPALLRQPVELPKTEPDQKHAAQQDQQRGPEPAAAAEGGSRFQEAACSSRTSRSSSSDITAGTWRVTAGCSSGATRSRNRA